MNNEVNTENVNDLETTWVTAAADKPKRGRKKKAESVESKASGSVESESVSKASVDPLNKPSFVDILSKPSLPTYTEAIFPYKTIRDFNGLIMDLEYKYDNYGFIDWRAMINPKHIVLNKNSVAKAGLNYESLSDEDREKYLREWPDDKKIIRLAGFKEVARLRGYRSVKNRIEQFGDKVICHCSIDWLPNFEGCFEYVSAASASPSNVAPEYSQALEAIACNRAFARAVRESLNIHVVSDEELDPNKVEEVSNAKIPSTHPRSQLIKKCQSMGIEFPAVKAMISGLGLDNVDIVSFDTVPGATAMAVLDEVRKS